MSLLTYFIYITYLFQENYLQYVSPEPIKHSVHSAFLSLITCPQSQFCVHCKKIIIILFNFKNRPFPLNLNFFSSEDFDQEVEIQKLESLTKDREVQG